MEKIAHFDIHLSGYIIRDDESEHEESLGELQDIANRSIQVYPIAGVVFTDKRVGISLVEKTKAQG